MQLLSLGPSRHVLLVVDTPQRSIMKALPGGPGTAEVVHCSSAEEAWSALASGRRYSAVVARRVDPELAEAASRIGTPVLIADADSLPGELPGVIAAAAPVPRADRSPDLGPAGCTASGRPRRDGRLVAVCGPGGTGASSVAAALAVALRRAVPSGVLGRHAPPARSGRNVGPPGLACTTAPADTVEHLLSDRAGGTTADPPVPERGATADPPVPARPTAPPAVGRPAGVAAGRVLLADFALRADQAFLHGSSDPGPGLLQLVEAARYRPVNSRDAGRHTVAWAGCRILPGLRRPLHWTAVGMTAFNAVLSGLLGIFDVTVADITGDFEGETDTGSVDVEERNHMARRSAALADAVVVVGAPGTNGARRLAGLVNDLLDLGVDPARIQPVINRIEPLTAWCDGFSGCTQQKSIAPSPWVGVCGLPAVPIGLPWVAEARDGLLPPEVVQPAAFAVIELLSRLAAPDRMSALVPVVPGSLGCRTP